MKKLSLVTLIFMGMQATSFAHSGSQATGYDQKSVKVATPCAEEAVDNLRSDLGSKGISFSLTYNYRLGFVFIRIFDSPPPGRVQSCVAHYNNDARNCDSAPTLIINYW